MVNTDRKILGKSEKILKKLISEEWLAAIFYEQMILACNIKEQSIISSIFLDIAKDEREDHYKKLIDFSLENKFDIPCKISEYEKYADENMVKQIDKLLKGKDVKYYISQAIEAEELAIKSYSDVLSNELLTDTIKGTIIDIYYDEIEHLSTLKSLLYAIQVGSKIDF